MPTGDAPKVVKVPVKRYDINLTLHDILLPLTQLSDTLAQKQKAPAIGSELHQHVLLLSGLARQLTDVIGRINEADPTLLAPTTQTKPPGT